MAVEKMTKKNGINVDEYDDEVYNVAKDLLEQEEIIDIANLVNNDPIEYIVKIVKRTIKGEDLGIRIILYSGLSCYTFNHFLSLSGPQLVKVRHIWSL